jgi:hypothetical protein
MHGWPTSCGLRHGDQLLGLPVCEKCFRYLDAVLWNAHASRLWNATIRQMRRILRCAWEFPAEQWGVLTYTFMI